MGLIRGQAASGRLGRGTGGVYKGEGEGLGIVDGDDDGIIRCTMDRGRHRGRPCSLQSCRL